MNKSATAALTTAAAAALLVTAAPSASADIEVGKGIRGVEMGMTKAEVRAEVGKPTAKRRLTTDVATYLIWKIGKRNKFEVRFVAGRTVNVRTRAIKDRTSGGLGVGTNVNELLNELRGVNCSNVGPGKTLCTVGELLAGEIVTSFRAKNNVVRSVEVGRVID